MLYVFCFCKLAFDQAFIVCMGLFNSVYLIGNIGFLEFVFSFQAWNAQSTQCFSTLYVTLLQHIGLFTMSRIMPYILFFDEGKHEAM